jgi:hypothetical protein
MDLEDQPSCMVAAMASNAAFVMAMRIIAACP